MLLKSNTNINAKINDNKNVQISGKWEIIKRLGIKNNVQSCTHEASSMQFHYAKFSF